jgi:hypothetical protein
VTLILSPSSQDVEALPARVVSQARTLLTRVPLLLLSKKSKYFEYLLCISIFRFRTDEVKKEHCVAGRPVNEHKQSTHSQIQATKSILDIRCSVFFHNPNALLDSPPCSSTAILFCVLFDHVGFLQGHGSVFFVARRRPS